MNEEKIHYGFWEKAEDSFISVYQYLESVELSGGFFAIDYLHGFCNVLAYKLNKDYQYPIYQCKNINGEMVHTYCIANDWYIDARGCTKDKREFFDEFGGKENLIIDIPVIKIYSEKFGFYENLLLNMTENLIKYTKAYSYPLQEKLKDDFELEL